MTMRTGLAALLLFSLASVARAADPPPTAPAAGKPPGAGGGFGPGKGGPGAAHPPVPRTTAGGPRPTALPVRAGAGRASHPLPGRAAPSAGVAVRPAPPTPAARHPVQRAHGGPVAAGSSRYLVTITPTPKAPVGSSIANVTLSTNHPKAETVTIRPVLSVTGPVEFVPQRLQVQPGPEAPLLHVKIRKPP